MNITFFSNYFNHHQLRLSDKLYEKNKSYKFISTKAMGEHRKKLGYVENDRHEYVIDINKIDNYEKQLDEIVNNTTVFIRGSASEKIMQKCIKTGRLFFRFSERPLKGKVSLIRFIKIFVKETIKNPRRKPIYMLCASAYTAGDYSKFFLFKNRTYKWGYFPDTKTYEKDELFKEKRTAEILWCGRFISWKHPDDAIRAVSKLKKDGYKFILKFIGAGELEGHLKDMAIKYDVKENTLFLGSMTPDKVRKHMEKAGIYLFTSDNNEGWGAVLNESMNSGCAVIASHLIGSVPFLIKNNENGLIYKSGDVDMLYEKMKYLLDNPDKQREFGQKAYETIVGEWNADVAAERFINLAQHILDGEEYPDLYQSGPCSKAVIISEEFSE